MAAEASVMVESEGLQPVPSVEGSASVLTCKGRYP